MWWDRRRDAACTYILISLLFVTRRSSLGFFAVCKRSSGFGLVFSSGCYRTRAPLTLTLYLGWPLKTMGSGEYVHGIRVGRRATQRWAESKPATTLPRRSQRFTGATEETGEVPAGDEPCSFRQQRSSALVWSALNLPLGTTKARNRWTWRQGKRMKVSDQPSFGSFFSPLSSHKNPIHSSHNSILYR